MTLVPMTLISAVAWSATPTASSVGTSMDGAKHPASHAFDGLLSTAWAEGDMGDGEGAWLEVRFDRPVDVASVSIWPGWLGGLNRELREKGRPRDVTLTFAVSGGEPVVVQDVVVDPGESGPLRHDIAVQATKARSMRITIDGAYSGGIFSDTYIAEVAVNLVTGDDHPSVGAVHDWAKSDSGKRVEASHRDKVIALFDKITGEQFGDRDSMRTLSDWASDGAPYMRQRVASRVPAGFRLNALRPDKSALEALLKLKDANAIPAIERASLRTTGSVSRDLAARAKMFDAYAELLGGIRRNVAPWGEEGFSPGAFRSLGEPLNLTIDSYGGIYVADVANHRLQRISLDTGVFEDSWGAPEPALTDFWFYKTRPHYAAGSQPSTGPSGFILPVDVALKTSREGDHVFVLDVGAKPDNTSDWGRITHITPDGAVAHVQELPFSASIGPSAGGEGHLMFHKNKLVVVWGNEGAVLSFPDWSVLQRFTLEDGVPSGAVMFKNGKMGLLYGQSMILYSTDGFRHGTIIDTDVLGLGYEDWAVTLDERGKMWAALDTGEIVKFKKPSKVAFRFTLSDYSLPTPRIAVVDDHVFVTSRDKIERGDALEILFKQSEDAPATGGTLDLGEQ
ncbi:MAG: hypothetical protein KTR31_15785 [Myxococcales bacterium]|nr:hypothetical protein [Myxococcales bacterium]